jgi:hypothetical protein
MKEIMVWLAVALILSVNSFHAFPILRGSQWW